MEPDLKALRAKIEAIVDLDLVFLTTRGTPEGVVLDASIRYGAGSDGGVFVVSYSIKALIEEGHVVDSGTNGAMMDWTAVRRCAAVAFTNHIFSECGL